MKSKMGNRILGMACGAGILISGIGAEYQILKSEIEKASAKSRSEIKIENLDYVLNARYLMLDLQNQETEVENQALFFELSDEDRTTICHIVAGEAKGESIEGKMAVAQCLLNAMAKEQMSAKEIKSKYKYSGWDSNLQNSNPDLWAEVVEAVSRVFDDGEFISENPILFFYAPKYAKGKWHETLPHDQTIGGHKFFYLKDDVTATWFLNLKGEN